MDFQLNVQNRNVADETLVEDLVRVSKELSKSPTLDEYSDHGKFHGTTLARRFGGWSASLQRAGLQLTRTPPNIPDIELFANLEQVWRRLGRQPLYREMCQPLSQYCAATYAKRFGNYTRALMAFVDFIKTGKPSPTEADVSAETNGPTS